MTEITLWPKMLMVFMIASRMSEGLRAILTNCPNIQKAFEEWFRLERQRPKRKRRGRFTPFYVGPTALKIAYAVFLILFFLCHTLKVPFKKGISK